MDFQNFSNNYFIRIDKGEELIASLKNFLKENKIYGGTFSGLGAVGETELGLFETKSKQYHSQKYIGDYEIVSLCGNISTLDNEVYIHAHIAIAGADHITYGGHLNSAIVSATVEITLQKFEGTIKRKFSDQIGLNLLDF